MLLLVNPGVAGVVKMLSGVFIAVCILVSIYSTQGLDLVSPLEATQSSTSAGGDASRAVDGVTDGEFFKGKSCSHTNVGSDNTWWYLNLGSPLLISKIVIYNRVDCCGERLIGAIVRVGNNNVSPFTGNTQCGSDITSAMVGSNPIEMTCSPAIAGQYVSVYLPRSEYLALCEVKVYEVADVDNPTITCPHDIYVRIGVVQSYNTVIWSDPDVMDNVDTGLIPTCTPSSGSSFEVGLTKVTCSATDATGNEDNCSFIVYIIDVTIPPLLTSEQAKQLDIVFQELKSLSCQELQERVYNTTEPPIRLSYAQMDKLGKFYPEYFKADTGGEATEIVQQCNPKKRSPGVNVCSSSIVNIPLQMALDNNGDPTFVLQLGRFGLKQKFQENLCTGNACVSNLACKCENQTSHTGKAVVSYMRRNDRNFHVIDIQLRSCLGYM